MNKKAVIVNTGGGYDNVTIVDRKTTDPSNFEVQVRIHANSLNYHDFAVVSGMWGPTEERVPMADGAGEVIKVGSKVKDFSPGDHVVSTFFLPGSKVNLRLMALKRCLEMVSMDLRRNMSPEQKHHSH
jgi:NADPH:quinone reductase-like Zn-dependent oxidoreductase